MIKQTMVSIDELPNDMLLEVLRNLSIPDLDNVRLINKLFYELLRLEVFWKAWFSKNRSFSSFSGSWRDLSLGFERVWGSGEISLGRSHYHKNPVQIFSSKCQQIAAGYDFTVALDKKNRVWCIGSNLYGQLIVKEEILRREVQIPGIKAKQIAAGPRHLLLIDLKNRILGSGENFYGQLEVHGLRAKKIAAGFSHSLFLDLKNRLWGSGQNLSGELGLGYSSLEYSPVRIRLEISQISARGIFSMILDEDSNLWVSGSNRYGQLGLKDRQDRYQFTLVSMKCKQISAGYYHALLIDLEDRVWTCGNNEYGQLGLGVEEEFINEFRLVPELKARKISAGSYHSLLIDLDSDLWGAGSNMFGQLAIKEHKVNRFTKVDRSVKVQESAAGNSHSSFIGFVEDGLCYSEDHNTEELEGSLPDH